MLRDRLGVSERWACRVVGQHRSTQRHEPKRAEDDAALRAELRQFSKDRPRWGYRRAHHQLRELGWEVNRKRVQRLWREEGLRVPAAQAQAPAAGRVDRPGRAAARRAAQPRVGVRLPVRPDRRRAGAEAAEHRRRVHARVAGDAGRAQHRRRHASSRRWSGWSPSAAPRSSCGATTARR